MKAVAAALAMLVITAPAAASPERLAAKPRRVVVKAGQTLSGIADRHNTPGGAYRLAYVNRDAIDHPDLIHVGTVLTLPANNGRKWVPRPEPKASRSWTPATSPSSSSPQDGSSHSSGGDCGGDLPSCAILACESGGDIRAENPHSSASGKWQITSGSWGQHGGYTKASDAPEEVQDERAAELWAGGAGASHWEQCL